MPTIRKETLAIIQPYMTAYRRPVYEELADTFDVTVLCDAPTADFGTTEQSDKFREYRVPLKSYFGGKIERQPGVLDYLIQHRPQHLVCNGAPRNLTFWAAMFLSRLLGISCIVHTQGPYKHVRVSWFQRAVYRLIATTADRMIMYAPIAAEAIKNVLPRRLHDKIMVAENSYTVDVPDHSLRFANTKNLLFIGRLRAGCGLGLLLSALKRVRVEFPTVELHVIGGGEDAELLAGNEQVVYHGVVYDPAEILRIAGICSVGVYPGDAGLSVIHYLALGLPVVVHEEIESHMGPEPSFIEFGITGASFKRKDASSLAQAVCDLLRDELRLRKMSQAARTAYQRLTNPSLAQRMAAIIKGPK